MSTAQPTGAGTAATEATTRIGTTATTRSRKATGNRAAERARARRGRRLQKSAPTRVTAAGTPVRSALARAPFAVALIAILAAGVGGVLYLNTKIDESGMRAEQARSTASQLRLEIEQLTRTAADLNATPRLAAEAQALGLVRTGDTAILTIGPDGAATLLGTPAPAQADPSTADPNKADGQ